ncbi:hypothetical protein [Sedimentitalea sp.]|uniref:hypothetical protein n=1 Tax=Sedimentitalea sp. TaxID=2048915 RepID=UPI00329A4E09
MSYRTEYRVRRSAVRTTAVAAFSTVVSGVASVANSADTITVPAGCEAVVTIEKQSCVATTVLDCGTHFEERSFLNGELHETHIFNKEWAFSGYSLKDGLQTVDISFDEGHSITLSNLVANGTATTARSAQIGTGRLKDLEYRLTSEATLTGETVELDGYPFQTGTLRRSFERISGSNVLDFEFEILVSRDLNLFIEGAYSRQNKTSDPETLDQTPISLRFPNEPGFLALRLGEACNG